MNTRLNSDLARERQDYADRQTRMVAADEVGGRGTGWRGLAATNTYRLFAVEGGLEWMNGYGDKILAADGRPFESVEEAEAAMEQLTKHGSEVTHGTQTPGIHRTES